MGYPIWVNGTWRQADQVSISINDLGFLRGYGIFDFFRIMDGKPIFLSDHLDRFLSSAEKMGIDHPYSKEDLHALIVSLGTKSTDSCLGVKMVLTGGDSLNGFEPILGKSNVYIFPGVFSFANPEGGLHLISKRFQREMSDIKSLNYAFAIRNLADIKKQGGDDVIYFSDEYGVSESSRSNLFFVKNGVIYTPGQFILEGITRKQVLSLAAENFEVVIGDFTLEQFISADEVFTTGSTKRVLPILSIDGKKIGQGKRGPITANLYDELLAREA